jgi:phosphate starvation-inducible protein PhoH and related proteins
MNQGTIFKTKGSPVFGSSPSGSGKTKPIQMLGMKGGKRGKHFRYRDLVLDSDDEGILGRSPNSVASSGYMMADDYIVSASPGFRGDYEFKEPPLKPRNANQAVYMETLESPAHSIVIATGPAGTGKTIMACHLGIRKLQSGAIQKLILTRPAVSVEEQHGFLPGTLEEKMEPWLRPVYDVFYQYFSPQKLQKLIQQQTIEICPLAYMRGRTFENAWIIADEAQNMTPNQMLMLLTRIGNNSKMIITGDPKQHDRGFEMNGLTDFLERYEKNQRQLAILGTSFDDVRIVKFEYKDVERHPVIRKILTLYE